MKPNGKEQGVRRTRICTRAVVIFIEDVQLIYWKDVLFSFFYYSLPLRNITKKDQMVLFYFFRPSIYTCKHLLGFVKYFGLFSIEN